MSSSTSSLSALDKAAAVSPYEAIYEKFAFGFDTWLRDHAPVEVMERLKVIDHESLGHAQFNQLLHLCHQAGVSESFFKYYFLSAPAHCYDVKQIQGFDKSWLDTDGIQSLDHIAWGMYRLYTDSLLFFGDVRTAFRSFRTMASEELDHFFGSRRFDTARMKRRGKPLPLATIAKEHRYLISEMACKSYDCPDGSQSAFEKYLMDAYQHFRESGGSKITVRKLLEFAFSKKPIPERQTEFMFSATDMLDEEVDTQEQLKHKYANILKSFEAARRAAMQNTAYFLSMANDLDIYVATSMRERDDFRKMADFCEKTFKTLELTALNLRYFDPTVSAAVGHEDKGLIECLMVKCAKVLVYNAGKKDSYGKDAEAAMALSLGKPVIFYCDEEQRTRIFSDIHPLSRLIDFKTGVAVGALVTSSQSEVVELLLRIFENRMEYTIEQPRRGYLRLRERLTGSVVRVQTNDDMLRETFWNYYHAQN
jgi:hypothetical protein